MGSFVWRQPNGATANCEPNPLMLDANGHSKHGRITNRITGNLEHGDLQAVSGIIIHQTYASTAQQTFDQYSNKDVNGAHFLIAKDGTIYQTASLHKKTWHVGKLRSKCVAEGRCEPVNPRLRNADEELEYIRSLGPKARSTYESKKPAADRYPMNADSIGIELVGETVGADPADTRYELYVTVTPRQNASLTWLVAELSKQFGVGFDRVLRHPVVSAKTPSEAATANWQVAP